MSFRWTHLALHVRKLQSSIAFYERFTRLVCSGAGSVASIMEPRWPAGCCQPSGRIERTQSAKKVPDVKFPIRNKSNRLGWKVSFKDVRILGQLRLPEHVPARSNSAGPRSGAD
jgi:hypothetical protein